MILLYKYKDKIQNNKKTGYLEKSLMELENKTHKEIGEETAIKVEKYKINLFL
jgi:hypothetical protein